VEPITVRAVSEADLGDLLALYAEAAEGNPVKAPADADTARTRLGAILADPARHLCVAITSTGVTGTAEMIVAANMAHHGMSWAVIENVVVTAQARRQGVGTALIRYLVEIAETAGCYKIQLLSAKHRAPAHQLYEKCGFRPLAEGFRLYLDGTY
jgi:ribosomal protein S18 acetylase RimI-like enzyme